jgi:hypothetical protein
MASEHSIRRYRHWYAKLLRLYPRPYYERFGEEMEQTFNDLLRDRAEEEKGLFGGALWMFVETSAGIMRENITFIIMQNIIKRLSVWAAVVALILTVPLVAMQFTDEVVWTLFDFIFAGTLLFGSALAYELVATKGGTIAYRAAVGVALAAALLLIWINGAVGIIGSENNPANLLYGGVLAIGLIGAIVALLEPRGMARTLFAMALAQALVPVIALIIWTPQVTSGEGPGIVGVFVLNSFFVMLFVGSALLFRRASAPGSKRHRRLA